MSTILGGTIVTRKSELGHHIRLAFNHHSRNHHNHKRPRNRPRRRRRSPSNPNGIVLRTNTIQFDLSDTSAVAIIIGSEYVTYANQHRMERLPGCHLDATHMQNIFVSKYGLNRSNMIVLKPDLHHAAPTRANILAALNYVFNLNCFETIYFFYSGHGSNTTRGLGISTEPDGQNEMIVPSDFITNGFLIDDNLNSIIINAMNSAGNVTKHFVSIFDSCFSGTVLDLPYEFSASDPSVRLVGDRKTISLGSDQSIISLSACLDSQTANSAYNLGNSRTWQGALTFAFCRYSNSIPGIISSINGSTLISSIQSILNRNGFSIQTTVLSSSNTATTASDITFPF